LLETATDGERWSRKQHGGEPTTFGFGMKTNKKDLFSSVWMGQLDRNFKVSKKHHKVTRIHISYWAYKGT